MKKLSCHIITKIGGGKVVAKARIIETENGIQGEFEVKTYDIMLRRLRDKGWMETDHIIKSGIEVGSALEIGPGPGYLGLEWLKKTKDTKLTGIEISPEMIAMAEKNAKEYKFADRATYIKGDAQEMPFDDESFDAVFTNGSLHEWSQPLKIFNEIHRVLKPNGRYFISDLRRDMNKLLQWLMWLTTKPKEIRPGLITSINAAYTIDEVQSILNKSGLKDYKISKTIMGYEINGEK